MLSKALVASQLVSMSRRWLYLTLVNFTILSLIGLIESSLGLSFLINNKNHHPTSLSSHNHHLNGTNRTILPTTMHRFKCQTHLNCSTRIFSLESYCCEWPSLLVSNTSTATTTTKNATPSVLMCCNWLEYVSTYEKSTATLAYKTPTLLTIITLLLLFIFFSFILYCMLMTCCYCFRVGLFKRPNIVVINGSLDETSSASGDGGRGSSGLGSDATSADLVVVTTPKSSSSLSSNLSSDAEETTYANRNRRNRSNSSQRRRIQSHHHHHHHNYHHNQHHYDHRGRSHTNSNNSSSSNQQQRRNNNKKQHQPTSSSAMAQRSPKARVYSTGGATSSNYTRNTPTTSTSCHRAHSRSQNNRNHSEQRLYADPNCYVDLENESPFLVPRVVDESARSRRSNDGASTPSTRLNSRRQLQSSRSNGMATATSNVTASLSRPAAISSDTAALMIINDDNIVPGVVRSASTTSSTTSSASSSSSINLNLVNAPSSLSVNQQNQNQNGVVLNSAPSYYFDEKPPSYDDIIKNNVPTTRAKLN